MAIGLIQHIRVEESTSIQWVNNQIQVNAYSFRGSNSAFFMFASMIRARGYKTFFMLNSAEHDILNAHKYKNIKKFSIFQAYISLGCYFSCS